MCLLAWLGGGSRYGSASQRIAAGCVAGYGQPRRFKTFQPAARGLDRIGDSFGVSAAYGKGFVLVGKIVRGNRLRFRIGGLAAAELEHSPPCLTIGGSRTAIIRAAVSAYFTFKCYRTDRRGTIR